jgi:hypothetical protein
MQSEEPFTRELIRLELSLLNINAYASDRMSDLLADDFIEFSSSGTIHNKGDIIASLQAELPALITVGDIKIRQLSPHAALVTYQACRHTEPPANSLRSSIWQHGPMGWQMLFHQGTVSP